MPIVVLATHNARDSGITKLSTNTSSCIIGPFSPHRLVTHVHTILHHNKARTRGAIAYKPLAVGRTHFSTGIRKRPVGLNIVRFGVLLILTSSPNHICSQTRLLSQM